MSDHVQQPSKEAIFQFGGYTAHQWQPHDRQEVADIVRRCLEPYGLQFEPEGADRDAIEVEEFYQGEGRGGEFWVVREGERGKVVGSGGFYQVEVDEEGRRAAEIRKMYLLPEARGKKLGRFLLEALERRVQEHGYHKIYIETASVLSEACRLYDSAGYQQVDGVETQRCDQRRYKIIASGAQTNK